MHFENSMKIALPTELVYKTLRDDIYKLVIYIPNVEKIELLDRKETDDKVYLTNKWYGKEVLPSFISQFIKTDDIAWMERAEWLNNENKSIWDYEPFIFKEYINAHGENTYSPDGEYTVITFNGDVSINFKDYPFIPMTFRDIINHELSQYLLMLIKSNFVSLVKGLEEYINPKNAFEK